MFTGLAYATSPIRNNYPAGIWGLASTAMEPHRARLRQRMVVSPQTASPQQPSSPN